MSYPIGTVVIGQNSVNYPMYNGAEGVITGGLAPRRGLEKNGDHTIGMKYLVQWADGALFVAAPHNLRKKQPPSGEQSIMDLFRRPVPVRDLHPH